VINHIVFNKEGVYFCSMKIIYTIAASLFLISCSALKPLPMTPKAPYAYEVISFDSTTNTATVKLVKSGCKPLIPGDKVCSVHLIVKR
jgi:hypothetical protein